MNLAAINTKELTLHTREGFSTQATLYGADQMGKQPCVIYLHGFKAFKDWGFVPYVGRQFAANGLCFLAANFSHNGIGPADPEELTDLARFRRNTLLREVEEALDFVDHAYKFAQNQPLGLMGHSRGGGISILAAAKSTRIHALATWAAISHVERHDRKQRNLWRKQGFIEVENCRNGKKLPIDTPLLDEIEKFGRTRLNILAAMKATPVPAFIVHGKKDQTVPFFEAETLHIYGDPNRTRMRIIPNADHTFGIQHPLAQPTPELEAAWKETVEFFRKHLVLK